MVKSEDRHRTILQQIAHRVMLERGLLPDFSPEVLAEVDRLVPPVLPRDGQTRDLRDLLWCSIDNDDSLDLDQLTVAEPLPDGSARVLVAVADVDALVKPRSAIDDHARTNTTSVYTAAEKFPMLPDRLSTDLSSLNPDEDRLATVVDMVVSRQGLVRHADLYPAMVRNHAKLTYGGVGAWFQGNGPHCPEGVEPLVPWPCMTN